MRETELDLRRSLESFLHVVRANSFMKKAQSEFEIMLSNSVYSVAMLEHSENSRKYSEAKDFFNMLLEKIKSSYGQSAVSDVYTSFKSALEDNGFSLELGVTDELSAEEKKEIFKKAFEKLVVKAESWDYKEDFFSYFLETVKEIIMPTEQLNNEVEEICPYCGGIPKRVPKSDFFGLNSSVDGGYVWGCECGAYAEMNEDGAILGKMGDAFLHQKRNMVKQAIFELCRLAGLTLFESLRWFSLVTGRKLECANDTEYLDAESCNIAVRVFLIKKEQLNKTEFSYPNDRNSLFMFFADGGRLMVCNAFGFRYGKILIPSEIGAEGICIYGKKGSFNIGLTDSLRYEFKNDELYIIHPSGKKEKFKMFPLAMRKLLFEIKEDEISVNKAG